jgi:phosphoglycerol transferase MdoB-like AlkP superfamily enzyme
MPFFKGLKTAKTRERKDLEYMKEFFKKNFNNAIMQSAALALALNLIIECLGRGSLIGGFAFLILDAKVFLYNTLIIFVTLSISLILKHRIFFYVVVSSIWITLGVTNGAVLSFRMTPFTVSDLALLENGLSILPNYMNTFEIILLVLAVICVIALFVTTYIFAPRKKERITYKINLILIVAFTLALFGLTNLGINNRWLSTYFSNLAYAYEDYGVPYCFINTWLNRGIPVPANYTEALVLEVFEDGVPMGIEEANPSIPIILTAGGQLKSKPNIVYVQLESFIDPTLIKDLEFSEDPIPNFHKLQKKYSTGTLRVPSVGAGTANTEFEVLTGMRIMSFGPGEYPYKTIMKETTCESVNYILKTLDIQRMRYTIIEGPFMGEMKCFQNWALIPLPLLNI